MIDANWEQVVRSQALEIVRLTEERDTLIEEQADHAEQIADLTAANKSLTEERDKMREAMKQPWAEARGWIIAVAKAWGTLRAYAHHEPGYADRVHAMEVAIFDKESVIEDMDAALSSPTVSSPRRGAITDTERLDAILGHGAWVTYPWPLMVSGLGFAGTQTRMIRVRSEIDSMIRAARKRGPSRP